MPGTGSAGHSYVMLCQQAKNMVRLISSWSGTGWQDGYGPSRPVDVTQTNNDHGVLPPSCPSTGVVGQYLYSPSKAPSTARTTIPGASLGTQGTKIGPSR